jgi:hypothetical protein
VENRKTNQTRETVERWEFLEIMSSDVKYFLMDMKSLYQQGVLASKNPSRFQRRLAIHYVHYVVEQILREKARDIEFKNSLANIGFEEIIKKLNKGKTIADRTRLLDLNTMRNNAQHRNIVASKEDVDFQVKIVEGFLKWSYKNYFDCDYDSLRLEETISDKEIRELMMKASEFISSKDFKSASEKMNVALANFKSKLFAFFADPKLWTILVGEFRLTNVLADLTLRIFFSNDPNTLKRLIAIPTIYVPKNGQVPVVWNVIYPTFETEEETRKEYDEILNIVLTYQDRFAF